MQMQSFMTTRVVSVGPDDTLTQVKEIFDNTRFHHLLVVDKGRLLGVLSDRDLLRHISPFVGSLHETTRDICTMKRRAHQIMAHHPITLGPTADLSEAVDIFKQHSISCIPIVDKDNHPVGIISWRDLLRFVNDLTPPAPLPAGTGICTQGPAVNG
ncbi:MAG TPA: CBS domain-containing protein [Candidatus Acidoferrum sp.]|nr:CBS domain-containing protein [Candidatus Acidoferrum sp.]